MSITQEYGWIHDVDSFPLGSALTVEGLEGDEVLHVVDAAPFDATGGALLLNGVTMAYVAADPDLDTITLAAPLAAGVEADVGDTVAVWDVDNQRVAGDQIAHVEFANGDGDDDPIPATLDTGVEDKLPFGSRGGRGETVLLEQSKGAWRVKSLVGVEGAATGSDVDAQVPAAPVVTVTSAAVVTGSGVIRAVVQIAWDPVEQYTDGSDILEPLTGYEVQTAPGVGSAWRLVTSTPDTVHSLTLEDLQPGVQWSYRVRAIDSDGRVGDWSDVETITTATDDTPPATPSAATVTSRMGVATATWDGKNSGGGAMDADLDYAEIHKSTVSGFSPVKGDPNTLVARLSGAGYGLAALPYATTYYFRIIAVDTSGNVSVPSEQTSSVVTPLVNADLIGQIIASANITDDAIGARHIVASESLTAKVGQFLVLEADMFSANLIEADFINFGSLNGQLITGLQIQTSTNALLGLKFKNTGFEAFDGSQRTFFVNAATGGVEMKGPLVTDATITGGTVQTAAWGAGRVLMRTVANPFEGGASWGVIDFENSLPGWHPGRIWASQAASNTEGTLRISSPHNGLSSAWTNAASITLVSDQAGGRRMNLYAATIEMAANQYRLTSANGTPIDFRLFNSGGKFLIQDNVGAGAGFGSFRFEHIGGTNLSNRLGTFNQNGGRHPFEIFGGGLLFNMENPGTGGSTLMSMFAATNNGTIPQLRGGAGFMALSFAEDVVRVTTWDASVLAKLAASEFSTTSDRRGKTNEIPVTGALAALRAMPVYDYDTPHGAPLPRTATGRVKKFTDASLASQTTRGRGVMSQDVLEVLPHAVTVDPNDEAPMTVNLYALLSTVIAAVQELDEKVESIAG